MTGVTKIVFGILGVFALALVLSQLVLGQLILGGPTNVAKLIKMHQHTGYTAVAVSGIYILSSLYAILMRRGEQKAEKISLRMQIRRYRNIFRRLIGPVRFVEGDTRKRSTPWRRITNRGRPFRSSHRS